MKKIRIKMTTNTQRYHHEVYMNFYKKVTDEERKNLFSQVIKMKRNIPLIKDIKINKDSPILNENKYDGMFEIIFKSEEDEQKYQENPEHKKVSDLIQSRCKEIEVRDYWS